MRFTKTANQKRSQKMAKLTITYECMVDLEDTAYFDTPFAGETDQEFLDWLASVTKESNPYKALTVLASDYADIDWDNPNSFDVELINE